MGNPLDVGDLLIGTCALELRRPQAMGCNLSLLDVAFKLSPSSLDVGVLHVSITEQSLEDNLVFFFFFSC